MKQYDHVFGVDVSKKTVDITHVSNQQFTHRQFMNNDTGMRNKNWIAANLISRIMIQHSKTICFAVMMKLN
jgi:hypothetical protein